MKRIRRSKEQWRELIKNQQNSGLIASEFCRQNNIDQKYFSKLKSELRSPNISQKGFMKVQINTTTKSPVMSINHNNLLFKFFQLPDAKYLSTLFKELG